MQGLVRQEERMPKKKKEANNGHTQSVQNKEMPTGSWPACPLIPKGTTPPFPAPAARGQPTRKSQQRIHLGE